MSHAARKISVTTKGTTNWKKTPKHYPAETVSYDYPRDSTELTEQARNDAAKQYRASLRTQVANPKEMSHLELTQSHRITG